MKTIKNVAEAKTLAKWLRERKAGKTCAVKDFEYDDSDIRIVRMVKVPYFQNGVPCGAFSECGEYDGEMMEVSELEVAQGVNCVVRATGMSMIDMGIHDGDDLLIHRQMVALSGDTVLASDGDCMTVKVFYRDAEGRPWLVPQNIEARYEVIPVTETVRIIGRVIGVMNRNPRCDLSLLMNKLNQYRAKHGGRRMECDRVPMVVNNFGPGATYVERQEINK